MMAVICTLRNKRSTKYLGKYPAVSLTEARVKRDNLLTVIHETGDLPPAGKATPANE
jgi:hypothetical protein